MKKIPLQKAVFACLTLSLLSSCFLNNDKEKEKEKQEPATTAAPTPHPDWIKQSNVYEVNIRQYSKEGTFKAFEASLPRLKAMGVDILWFMPVTPISKVDRKGTLGSYYAVADYKAINPEYGTLDDFKSVVNKAHELGFKVITDWVANHTGADHPWLKSHDDFYNHDSTGKVMYVFDWSDTRDLNFENRAMRDSMIAAMKYWLQETNIDGFRCDVANEVPTDFWKECIDQLRTVKQIFMLAEGDKPELHTAGFDASYPWKQFHAMVDVAAGKKNVLFLDSMITDTYKTYPANSSLLYFTSNHDENSWNKSDFGTFPGLKHNAFAVLTQTAPGALPLIYGGQEEPVLRAIPFFEKDSMGFKNYARAKFYKTLLELRKKNPALAVDASFKKVSVGNDNALYAFVRQKDNHKIAVILNLSPKEQTIRIKDPLLTGNPMNTFMGMKEPLALNHSFNIEQWGYIIYEYE